jgi:hypothetical protein
MSGRVSRSDQSETNTAKERGRYSRIRQTHRVVLLEPWFLLKKPNRPRVLSFCEGVRDGEEKKLIVGFLRFLVVNVSINKQAAA